MDDFIQTDYETLKQKSKRAVYGALVRACEAKGVLTPSYNTFAQAINQRPHQEQVEKRQGCRAAYPYEPFYLELNLTTPRHGDRPFEIGHIDHTELDIELVCSRTGRNLGRPWPTFLVDAFCRRLLAIHLSFEAPSYRACMMILRECVRRHSRLPQIVVVDGGREFASVYFETLLARYECIKKTRPSAKPRFGSVCERLFGTANTTFVHNLLGNTQLMAEVRQVTKSVNPKQLAVWDLGRLYQRLGEWAYEVYDTIDHPALGQSPREVFVSGMARSGQRPQRLIPYDAEFQMLTLPTTPKGTAVVQVNRGVKINSIYYWADAFRDREVERTRVAVRYDPFDISLAYAFVKQHWVSCVSEYYADFKGRSEREVRLASQELRQRQLNHSRQFSLTARKLAAFLSSLEAEEVLLAQRLQDMAMKGVIPPTTEHHPEAGQPAAPTFTAQTNPGETTESWAIYEDF
jgi:transposase InsO family protein